MLFLTDENVPAPSVARLRESGLDIVSVLEDHRGMEDPDVIRLARRLDRTLITFDSDIGERIFKDGDLPPPGVIYLRFIQSDAEETARVVLAVLDLDSHEIEGRYLTYRNGRLRSQPLP